MRKILVLCDDVWHPAEVIQRGLASFEKNLRATDRSFNYKFDFVMAAKDILTPEFIRQYPLIICCKSNNVIAANPEPWFENTVTEVMGKEFRDYVESGSGFLAIHSGNAFLGDGDGVDEYCAFVGNRFLSHPLRCEVLLEKIKSHPIMEDVADSFSVRDEHYKIELLAEDADIFLSSSSPEGGIEPAGYTRAMGKGRLCVLTPGHTLSVWENDYFQKILKNAIEWCLQNK